MLLPPYLRLFLAFSKLMFEIYALSLIVFVFVFFGGRGVRVE